MFENMSEFEVYFIFGFQHILDWLGYDHMIFLLALLAPISLKEWKKILFLITAFTVGHSISLALSVLNIVSVNSYVIELLIPISILLTAISNITINKYLGKLHYIITILFGLIHGMGFSGELKSILGKEQSIITPLLSFNIGLEAGQILFTGGVLLLVSILYKYLSVNRRTINLAFSGIALAISLFLIVDRI